MIEPTETPPNERERSVQDGELERLLDDVMAQLSGGRHASLGGIGDTIVYHLPRLTVESLRTRHAALRSRAALSSTGAAVPEPGNEPGKGAPDANGPEENKGSAARVAPRPVKEASPSNGDEGVGMGTAMNDAGREPFAWLCLWRWKSRSGGARWNYDALCYSEEEATSLPRNTADREHMIVPIRAPTPTAAVPSPSEEPSAGQIWDAACAEARNGSAETEREWAITELRKALAHEPGGPEVTITKAVAAAILDDSRILRSCAGDAVPVAWMVEYPNGERETSMSPHIAEVIARDGIVCELPGVVRPLIYGDRRPSNGDRK